jgi:hypothetical protein
MSAILEKYGRFGLDAVTAATTVSFAAAKAATKMGVRASVKRIRSSRNIRCAHLYASLALGMRASYRAL